MCVTDWLEVGLFSAAIGADVVALYAVWAANRNQLLAADRERRRENYASMVLAFEYLQEDFEELGNVSHKVLAVAASPSLSSGGPGPTAVNNVISRLPTWVNSGLSGSSMDISMLTDGIPPKLVPSELPYLLTLLNGLLTRVSHQREVVFRAMKMLSLSATPDKVVDASNDLKDWLVDEMARVTFDPNVSNQWSSFRPKIDALEALMQKDLDSAIAFG